MIEFKNVYIKYINDFYSLYNKNFKINCSTVFVGDAVDGTKAVMRLISKIDKSYDGEIFIDNKNIKDIKDKDLSVAYIPEFPELFSHKNIFKNLYYPLKIRKINKNIAKNTINNAIFEYKLNNFPEKIKNMNLSQKKIICLVRAILRKPKYILLENFFKDLENSYYELSIKILNSCDSSIVIACEENIENIDYFNNFNKINLNN